MRIDIIENMRQKYKFYQYGNVMIDLETLSTKTNAQIISIGAIEFNKLNGQKGNRFNVGIKQSEWGKNGRDIDGNTIAWWMKQDKDAVDNILNITTDKNGLTLKEALEALSGFIHKCDNTFFSGIENKITRFNLFSDNEEETIIIPEDDEKRRVTVWGNGSTMDITILQSAYEYFGMSVPWQYWAVNDVRTIVDLNPEIKKNCTFEGVKHTPLADCEYQIKYLTETIKNIREI